MEIQEIHGFLRKMFGEGVGDLVVAQPVDPFIVISPPQINAVCFFLRDEENLQFDFLNCISGVDFDNDNLAVVYHLYSYPHNLKLVLKVFLPKSNPKINTVSDVWAAANWHEREAFDLLGIEFEGHPDFRRILLPEDWKGHPLRKDYKVQEFYNGMKVPY
ncbi:MAG: NADH-quinone oxidoreductase subunit C [Ignavibacteria bacterium]|nr:NADH-quinone oxidoreductase subunit C [Ignavibacteria bacterium]